MTSADFERVKRDNPEYIEHFDIIQQYINRQNEYYFYLRDFIKDLDSCLNGSAVNLAAAFSILVNYDILSQKYTISSSEKNIIQKFFDTPLDIPKFMPLVNGKQIETADCVLEVVFVINGRIQDIPTDILPIKESHMIFRLILSFVFIAVAIWGFIAYNQDENLLFLIGGGVSGLVGLIILFNTFFKHA